MPPDNTDNPNPNPPVTPQNDLPPVEPAPVQTAPVQPPPQQNTPRQSVMHSPSKIKAIKDEERAKTERNIRRQLDQEAVALGFRNHEELKQAAADRNARRDPPPPAQPSNPQQPRTQNTRTDNRVAQLAEDRRKANRARAQTDRRNKELERELARKEVEWELKMIAVRNGVRDVDYAVTLIQRHTANMSSDDLNAFDEEKYFREDLRKERPYLYGEEVRPVHTDPATPKVEAAPSQTPPTPNKDAPPATSKVVDSKSMTRDEFEAHLKSQGLGNALTLARPS